MYDYAFPDPVMVALLLVGTITGLAVLVTAVIILTGHEAPDGLMAVGAGGVGSLSTFLARGRQ